MNTDIYNIWGRCGCGKSRVTLNQLYLDYLGGDHAEGIITIFASKTIALSAESYQKFIDREDSSGKRIDTSTSGNVIRDITSLIARNYMGVIFTTHASLANIPNAQLQNVYVVCDEVPQSLINHVSVKFNDDVAPDFFNDWLIKSECNFTNYQTVTINPVYADEVADLLKDIERGEITAYSDKVAEVLGFLVGGSDVMYTTAVTSDSKVKHLYQAIAADQLLKVVSQPIKFTVLAASLKESVFGFVAQSLLGFNIIEVDTDLEKKHKNNVTIIPFLKAGVWSSTFKNSPACDALILDGDRVDAPCEVSTIMQNFVLDNLGSNFLLFKNARDTVDEEVLSAATNVLSTSVHGINKYRGTRKAAFIASLRPDPFEIKSMNMFSIDNDLDAKELIEVAINERCYESMYQCMGRTGIRNEFDPADTSEYTFVVPDMGYARYFAKWFEDGCATIDTSRSYTTMASAKKDNRKDSRLQIAVSVLTDKKNKVGKMPEILKAHRVSDKTFRRYKNEFKDNLQVMGLVK